MTVHAGSLNSENSEYSQSSIGRKKWFIHCWIISKSKYRDVSVFITLKYDHVM